MTARRRPRFRALGLTLAASLGLAAVLAVLVALTPGGWAGALGDKFPAALPSQIGAARFKGQLVAFLKRRGYAGWVHDSEIRGTGPWIDGQNYGTHPAVRVYYSPEVWAWLQGGRRGVIPDGAVIIKEQYDPPAGRQPPKLVGYAVMVRDSQAWAAPRSSPSTTPGRVSASTA